MQKASSKHIIFGKSTEIFEISNVKMTNHSAFPYENELFRREFAHPDTMEFSADRDFIIMRSFRTYYFNDERLNEISERRIRVGLGISSVQLIVEEDENGNVMVIALNRPRQNRLIEKV